MVFILLNLLEDGNRFLSYLEERRKRRKEEKALLREEERIVAELYRRHRISQEADIINLPRQVELIEKIDLPAYAEQKGRKPEDYQTTYLHADRLDDSFILTFEHNLNPERMNLDFRQRAEFDLRKQARDLGYATVIKVKRINIPLIRKDIFSQADPARYEISGLAVKLKSSQ